jgi:hypothetical protein
MRDLIEALTILQKYQVGDYPTHCEHDVLMVQASREVSPEDEKRLGELSFRWSDEYESWISYRFGSA